MRAYLLPVVGLLLLISGCSKPAQNAALPPPVVPAQVPGPPPVVAPQVPGPPPAKDPTVPVPVNPAAATPSATSPPTGPVITDAGLEQKRQESRDKIKKIGLALLNFEDRNGAFPPAYVADAAGKPLYSWRVLILPFLGQQAIFDRFDKTKAWDSPENLEISNTALDVFKSPADSAVAANGVSYLAIVGDGYVFNGLKQTKTTDIRDGLSRTIAAIEIGGVAGSWAAPIDLKATSLQWKLGNATGEVHSPYPEGLSVIMCDASPRIMRAADVPELLPAALGINDGIEIRTY